MKLGTLALKNNLILAPLENITTSPYRRFCREFFKIGLVCVPMIHSKRLMESPKSIGHELAKLKEERPISVQLITGDSDSLKHAVNFLESYEFDVLDINAGCPSKRAIRLMKGGYLLKDVEKLRKLVSAALKFSSKPVSLKCRIGFDDLDQLEALVDIANNSGIEFITIHARLVKKKYDVKALDLETLKLLKERIDIPVIGNGDIDNPNFAKHFIDYTNVDALMIGRGSIGNPGIFHQIHHFLTEKKIIPFLNNLVIFKQNLEVYERIIEEFLEGVTLKYVPEEFKFIELKKNAIWLTRGMLNSTDIRRKLSKPKNLDDLRIVLEEILMNNQ